MRAHIPRYTATQWRPWAGASIGFPFETRRSKISPLEPKILGTRYDGIFPERGGRDL